MIRQLPPPPPATATSASPPTPPPATAQPMPMPMPQPPKGKVKPLSEKRYAVQFTVDEATFHRLEHVKHLTKHRGEGGSLESLMDRAIKLLEEELEKERLGKTSRPHTKRRPMKDPGAVATSEKRKVFARDEEQCTFVDRTSGKRCPARTHLEIDHVIPRSRGGTGTEENLRLRCRTHNRLAAEESFGRQHIETKIAERKKTKRMEDERRG
jgi:hypothetical protein